MRLYQITEAISLSDLQNPLKDEFYKGLTYSLQNAAYKNSIPDDLKQSIASGEDSLSNILPYVKEKLRNLAPNTIAQQLPMGSVNNGGPYSTMMFKDMKSGGSADGSHININRKLLDIILDYYVNYVYDRMISSIESNETALNQFFELFYEPDRKDISAYSSGFENKLNELVSVIIHELTHVQQHQAQRKKGRADTEYRSYLEPNKSKFYQAVNSVAQDASPSADSYRLYRGSPQETAAFAHQSALDWLNAYGVFDDQYDAEGLKGILDAIKEDPSFVNKMFNDRDNPKEYKVFKRFNKQVYQEIVRTLEKLIKKQTPK